jgi:diaminohydroxyphosphoribosylaminopyrimidine deaminase/5-amino-6-(5-phosphoribosylamino)uracil reductase
MALAVQAASQTGRSTRPNPRVGAALWTRAGDLVVNAHQQSGQPHAEVLVLREAQERRLLLQGAKMAVTLEPCSHHGKTPPCVDALLLTDISEFFVGGQDPNPKVSGRGLEKLRQKGRVVHEGVLADSCSQLNSLWLWAQTHRRPYVVLKTAQTALGQMIRKGSDPSITDGKSREDSHRLRRWAGSLVTSLETIKSDKPRMTARNREALAAVQPRLWVLGWTEARNLSSDWDQSVRLGSRISTYWSLQQDSLARFVGHLYDSGEFWVVVESGPRHSQMWLDSGFVAEHWCYQSPIQPSDAVGPLLKAPKPKWSFEEEFPWGDKLSISGYVDVNVKNLRKLSLVVED